MILQSFQDYCYSKAISNRGKIITLFKIFYGLLISFLLFGAIQITLRKELFDTYYELGILCGKAALVVLSIVIFPGILGRFSIEIKITRIITTFRRQLGILTYLLALTHYSFVRLLGYVLGIFPFKLPFALFELMGMGAFYLMTLLFITSNNTSIKKLGKWWKRLHRIIYIIVWFVVVHTILQEIGFWSLYIGLFAILETVSLVFSYAMRKRI